MWMSGACVAPSASSKLGDATCPAAPFKREVSKVKDNSRFTSGPALCVGCRNLFKCFLWPPKAWRFELF